MWYQLMQGGGGDSRGFRPSKMNQVHTKHAFAITMLHNLTLASLADMQPHATCCIVQQTVVLLYVVFVCVGACCRFYSVLLDKAPTQC